MTTTTSRQLSIWLLTGCVMIFLMVIIGGITRLTGSGLSITEWNVVMGTIPPMNDQEWEQSFQKYQATPQFQKVNSDFTLSDFKGIFWWEYLHRLVGRLIGLVFLIPFFVFLVKGKIDNKLFRKFLLLFFLGGIQGFLGWFMVKSGLSERTSVSHIRLAIHLFTAFITFGFTFWFALELIYKNRSEENSRHPMFSKGMIILSIITLQVIYGAFVAGTHAGHMYNTYPLMDGQWVPTGIATLSPFLLNLTDNPVALQFIHRILAIVIVLLVVLMWLRMKKIQVSKLQRIAFNYLLAALGIQFTLGICTLLSNVQIALALLHQVGAFLLFTAGIFVVFQFRENDLSEIVPVTV